ncbi:olfactory receptor 10G4-like [Scleropages formosus]|uniref:olfactory receptor 10G4-like n=1 Tax=Scleropages formosus TaxID=113540 RepID=UPI0010FAC0F7|nr:olfactory receptor 10G4-like [Scleropages formosus]XP_029106702.1 olfactory receptor 10G4-like [Scleropages formosus]
MLLQTCWEMLESNVTIQRITEFVITGLDHLPNQNILGVLILLTYSLILLGSSANICIIASDWHLHRPMYIFICNLAVIDIMFTTSASTTLIALLLAGVRNISYHSCISHMFVYHLGDICLCFALTLMAFDRMIAISNPLRYHSILTNSRTFALIALSWMIGIAAIGVLTGIVDRLPYCQPIIRYTFCSYAALVRAACVDPEPYFVPSTILLMWFLGGHFPLILATYVKIIYTVVRLADTEGRKQMISTCLSHAVAVFCYYAPKLVSGLLTRVGVTLDLTERNALMIILTLVPSLMNPTVYCFRTKEIRSRLIQILKRNRALPIK